MKPLIIANWKSNKTRKEALEWIENLKNEDQEFVLCPPFTLIEFFSDYIKKNNLKIVLGAQDVSPYEEGPFTGEVTATQIKEFGDYVLIGHSERRRLFGETDELLEKKVEQANSAGLKPIFFAQDTATKVPINVDMIVYEPPEAISNMSGGVAEKPEDVEKAAKRLLENYPNSQILYGASVNEINVNDFTSLESITGVVVGNKSLDPTSFIKILQNA